jgi:hypothetical protein
LTSISAARWRMAWLSCQACMRKSVSMETPKTFSIRRAISGDRTVLWLTRSDRIARGSATIPLSLRQPGWVRMLRPPQPETPRMSVNKGNSGEHLVMAELLARGFDGYFAARMLFHS